MGKKNMHPVRWTYKPYFFSQQTVFFSHTKSTNSTFSHDLSVKQAQTNRALIGSRKVKEEVNQAIN